VKKNKHIGSNFDDFLREEGILAEAEATAIKRVIAYQIEKEMAERQISKSTLARMMRTSRSSLNRLLDPENPSVTLRQETENPIDLTPEQAQNLPNGTGCGFQSFLFLLQIRVNLHSSASIRKEKSRRSMRSSGP